MSFAESTRRDFRVLMGAKKSREDGTAFTKPDSATRKAKRRRQRKQRKGGR